MSCLLCVSWQAVRGAYLRLRDQGIINLSLGRRATISKIAKPTNKATVESEIAGRLEEITTDALLMGLSATDIQKLLEHQGQKLKI
jgi:DNA-binding transcriptional regulator YhcF (GntR family)